MGKEAKGWQFSFILLLLSKWSFTLSIDLSVYLNRIKIKITKTSHKRIIKLNTESPRAAATFEKRQIRGSRVVYWACVCCLYMRTLWIEAFTGGGVMTWSKVREWELCPKIPHSWRQLPLLFVAEAHSVPQAVLSYWLYNQYLTLKTALLPLPPKYQDDKHLPASPGSQPLFSKSASKERQKAPPAFIVEGSAICGALRKGFSLYWPAF